MMLKKITMAACFASALMMVSAPASAAAYFIGGKWYFFSLNFDSLLAKISGGDLRAGTTVKADVEVLASNVQCSNPQGKVISGVGPKGGAYQGTSPIVTANNLTKTDNKVTGNIYQTTTTVDINTVRDADGLGLCKDAPGTSAWQPLYWQDRNCDKNKAVGDLMDPICYKERATKVNGALTYLTGPLKGQLVGNPGEWTFVYLPTAFKFKATLNVGSATPDFEYGSCTFPLNVEPNAASYGQPYSINNPPVNGWAASPGVGYNCVAIPAP